MNPINNNRATGNGEQPDVMRLVRESVAGKREAFDEIVFLYRDQVYATAWHMTRNAEDAMDVSQEVFLRAYRALSSFKGKAKFSTWLHRITMNTCIDHIRREKKHSNVASLSDTEFEANWESRTPDRTVEAGQRDTLYHKQIQRRVLQALQKISTRQRQVFVLRYFHDLELREIAEVLKCSEGAVKRHLHRSQLRLRELLRDISPE